MDKVTGRSTARRSKHAKRDRRTTADLSQVLRMTPTRGSRETLATATALQRTRAAAIRRDREAALAAEREGRVNAHPSEHDRILASGCKQQVEPPVAWTTEEDTENTDADDECSDDEEKYEQDEKTRDDEPSGDNVPEAAAIAAAEDHDTSLIQTPADERDLEPTQSDNDFIATDEDPVIETDDPDYYPSTAEDDDGEEEELYLELLSSGKLSEAQTAKVRTRLRKMQRKKAIARTLFAQNQDETKPVPEEQPASISPPVVAAKARRPNAARGHTPTPRQPARSDSSAPATAGAAPKEQVSEQVETKAEEASEVQNPTPKEAKAQPVPTRNREVRTRNPA